MASSVRNGPVVVSWSTGKDAAYSLYKLLRGAERPVSGLLTTVTKEFDRVSMHGVRRSLLEHQARAVKLPIFTVEIPFPCPNTVYEQAMGAAVERMIAAGVTGIAFGDLFLEEIRDYRIQKLQGTGLEPLFPLWGRPTDVLAREIIRAGFDARVVCVDPRKLGAEFAGRKFDESFLRDLPPGVDPCGENGEFHTCVVAGPIFSGPIAVRTGPTVTRDGFVFADLLPTEEAGGESGSSLSPTGP